MHTEQLSNTHHSLVWKPMSLPFLLVVCLNPKGLLGLAYTYLQQHKHAVTVAEHGPF